jgi:N-methylhydantoinase A
VTAAVNASVQPLLERYVARLADQLAAKGYARDLLVMNGNGGMVGPRRGARGGQDGDVRPRLGRHGGCRHGSPGGTDLNLLTYDMGGTSTDVAMIRNGVAPVSNEIEVEYAMPIHVPMVDVRTVGAGGGPSPGSTRAACCGSGRKVRDRRRGRSATGAAAPASPSRTRT